MSACTATPPVTKPLADEAALTLLERVKASLDPACHRLAFIRPSDDPSETARRLDQCEAEIKAARDCCDALMEKVRRQRGGAA